jgi:hypothetical protein
MRLDAHFDSIAVISAAWPVCTAVSIGLFTLRTASSVHSGKGSRVNRARDQPFKLSAELFPRPRSPSHKLSGRVATQRTIR